MKKIEDIDITFFVKESIIILLLFLSFSRLLGPLSVYLSLLIFPLFFLKIKIMTYIDVSLILLILFSVSYSFITTFHGLNSEAPFYILFYLIYPPLFYIIGKYFFLRWYDYKYFFFALIVISLAFITVIDVLKDIAYNGFISLSRGLYDIDEKRDLMATLFGAKVSLGVASIALIFAYTKNKIEKYTKTLFIIFSIICLVTIIHLINRTGVVIALVSIFVVLIFNLKHFRLRKILLIVSVLIVISAVSFPYFKMADAVDAYSERQDALDNEASTAGGRFQRWEEGLNSIHNNPLGGGLFEGDKRKYAHNMWLDVSEMGGIIPFLSILLFTLINLFKNFLLIRGLSKENPFLSSLLIVLNIGFFLTCFVEPMIEGDFMYVCGYFCFFGASSVIYKNFKSQISEFEQINETESIN